MLLIRHSIFAFLISHNAVSSLREHHLLDSLAVCLLQRARFETYNFVLELCEEWCHLMR